MRTSQDVGLIILHMQDAILMFLAMEIELSIPNIFKALPLIEGASPFALRVYCKPECGASGFTLQLQVEWRSSEMGVKFAFGEAPAAHRLISPFVAENKTIAYMITKLGELPANLPAPVDDGAADHLEGALLPDLTLGSGDGPPINLSQLKGRWVIYVYPMTGRPDVPLPQGWDGVPGARGCTPQSCSFRDQYAEFATLNAGVFGLSAQSTEYQCEARERLHLPFQLLSDDSLELKRIINLPTFSIAGMELYKRLTLIVNDRTIEKVFYPVFPPDQNAEIVLAWLRENI